MKSENLLSKKEMEEILREYDKQEADSPSSGKEMRYRSVRCGSFSKFLFSLQELQNPRATSALLKDLNIRDLGRDSFLNRHSSFAVSGENSIEGILTKQQSLYIREESKRIYERIASGRSLKKISNALHRLEKLDTNNGHSIAARGRWSLYRKRYKKAITDFSLALSLGCWDHKSVTLDLSKAHIEAGKDLYAKKDFANAADQFFMALERNNADEAARSLLKMCQDQLAEELRRFGNFNSFAIPKK